MTTIRSTEEGPVYERGFEDGVEPLGGLLDIWRIAAEHEHVSLIAIDAALLQHADQERIAKALEALLEPLCDIANSITRYEGRS